MKKFRCLREARNICSKRKVNSRDREAEMFPILLRSTWRVSRELITRLRAVIFGETFAPRAYVFKRLSVDLFPLRLFYFLH